MTIHDKQNEKKIQYRFNQYKTEPNYKYTHINAIINPNKLP